MWSTAHAVRAPRGYTGLVTRILPIPLGFDTCYVLLGEGVVVVDAGQPRKGHAFLRGLAKASIDPTDVGLILLTHAHWDHMGSASELQEVTGAPLWVHATEASWVTSGRPPLPPGVTRWGRAFMAVHRALMPFIDVPPARVDRELGDDSFRLDDFGIHGCIVHTPGHSPGSISLVLDSGEAFVGDLAMNRLPLCSSPSLPIFADDIALVRQSWEKLLRLPVSRIFPAHGASFEVDVVRGLLAV